MRYQSGLLLPATILALATSAMLSVPSGAVLHTVSVADFMFTPNTLTIAQGDSIKWVWVSGFHTTTSGPPCTADGNWSAPIDPSHLSFTRAFNVVGAFPYFCMFHCASNNMVGMITVMTSSSVPPVTVTPARLSLAASPNPFRAPAQVSFSLPAAGHVRLAIYDASGREVSLLADGSFSAGPHSFRWDGRTTVGVDLPSGMYFARASTDGGVSSVTLIKVK